MTPNALKPDLEVARFIILNEHDLGDPFNPTITLSQKALDSGHNAGMNELPGGKPEPTETLMYAGIREAYEEVGLSIIPIMRPIEIYRRPMTGQRKGQDHVTHVGIATTSTAEIKIDNLEVRQAVQSPLFEALKHPALSRESRAALIKLGNATLHIAQQLYRK